MKTMWWALALCLVMISPSVMALETNAAGQTATTQEKGWFWQYWYKLQAEQKAREEAQVKAEKQREKKTPDCKNPQKWTVDCGFVDPAGDYEFSQHQRKKLEQSAAMNPNDANKVKAYQEFNAWSVKQAFTMMRMWEWNQVQDQSLNNATTSPVAAFAIMAMNDIRTDEQLDVMKAIKAQGGFLVFFSRTACKACGVSAPVIQGLGRMTGLDVYELSLDGGCYKGFSDKFCLTGPRVTKAAEILRVAYVPDVWLYLGKQDLWFRVSSGMEASDAIAARIQMFFTGVVQAVAKGMNAAKGQPAPVDFNFSPETISHHTIEAGVPNAAH